MDNKTIKHLKELEAESIYVLREVAAQFERPVILFSGGKDSIVITYLAYKAFYPAKIPFPLLHIDTGHNFEETIQYRDELAKKLGAELIVGSVQESIDKGRVKEETGYYASRNKLQTTTLLDTLEKYKFDAAIGGARRDEEKARAKERFFSHRDEFGQWNPKNQRPELWNIFNGRKNMGEHFRVFPISNWTEMDVWQYIFLENIPMPSLYFTHEREVFNRDGQWLAALPCIKRKPTEEVVKKLVRCRTIGDITCTGLTESKATTVADIIDEIASTRITERVAHPTGRLNIQRMEKLCKVLSDLKNMGHEIILVSSGAIAMGFGKLNLSERPKDVPTKQASAAVGQCELMYIYDKLFTEYNHTVAQLLITAPDIEEGGVRKQNFHNTLARLLELGALPVINENDTISTEEFGIGDNDTLSAIVAVTIQADLLILLSDIDGLFDGDPRKNPDAKLIDTVEKIDEHIISLGGGSGSNLGTGGMATKLRAAQMATAAGCEMVIANGQSPEVLYDVAAGKRVGTRFLAKRDEA